MHPSSGQELIDLVMEETRLSRDEIIESMLRLEDHGEISFTTPVDTAPVDIFSYVATTQGVWYLVVVALSVLAVASTFISPHHIGLIYIRYLLAPILLMFIPGLCATRILYIGEEIGLTKLVAMSLGISVSLVSVIGITLNYTPWGIGTASVTFTVFLLVLALSTVAITREFRRVQLDAQSPR